MFTSVFEGLTELQKTGISTDAVYHVKEHRIKLAPGVHSKSQRVSGPSILEGCVAELSCPAATRALNIASCSVSAEPHCPGFLGGLSHIRMVCCSDDWP